MRLATWIRMLGICWGAAWKEDLNQVDIRANRRCLGQGDVKAEEERYS
jgi:hypothetical protein